MRELNQQISEHAAALMENLQAGDSTKAWEAIDQLAKARERSLFQEIGKLTRTVHESIKNFHLDSAEQLDPNAGHKSESRMIDATDRLQFVITLTENAANKTMDMVEDSVPVAKELSDSSSKLKQEWQKLMRREMSGDEFRELYKQMDKFLDFSNEKASTLEANLSAILMAQDYQDLTGQVIKKVINLVHEVEGSLVKLVKMASQIETITGVTHENVKSDYQDEYLEGPVANKDRSDVVESQDDVDDLLSSLGF